MLIDADPVLATGEPSTPPNLYDLFGRALTTALPQRRIRLGFAYATEAGLTTLLDCVARLPGWGSAEKHWLLGLHHGITEPSAIQSIANMQRSTVRLFSGGNKLRQEDLLSGQKFHGKVFCVDSGSASQIDLIIVGSANLTGAALGRVPQNYEIFLGVSDSNIPEVCSGIFNRWWSAAWNASLPVTDSLLKEYVRFRSRLLRKNPDLAAGFDPPRPERVRNATNLWIDAGAMSGGSRNQVEFSRSLAEFFGPIRRFSRKLRISALGKYWDDRPLSPKTTTFGVDIWRLGLPTIAQGGFEYPGRAIRLQKHQDEKGEYFELSVSDIDSREHRRWETKSHLGGYAGLTSGKRAFGFFGR